MEHFMVLVGAVALIMHLSYTISKEGTLHPTVLGCRDCLPYCKTHMFVTHSPLCKFSISQDGREHRSGIPYTDWLKGGGEVSCVQHDTAKSVLSGALQDRPLVRTGLQHLDWGTSHPKAAPHKAHNNTKQLHDKYQRRILAVRVSPTCDVKTD